MNNQEVTMQHTRNGNRFQVLDKATQAVGTAISLALRARGILAPTGACRVRHCAYDALRAASALRTMSNRATLAVHPSGAAVDATRQAAGAPSARSQPSPVTFARPRRWCDAGPTAARAAADQKAGAPGHHPARAPEGTGSTTSESPTLPRRRSMFTFGSSAFLLPSIAETQPPP